MPHFTANYTRGLNDGQANTKSNKVEDDFKDFSDILKHTSDQTVSGLLEAQGHWALIALIYSEISHL